MRLVKIVFVMLTAIANTVMVAGYGYYGNRDWVRYLADYGFGMALVDSMSFRKTEVTPGLEPTASDRHSILCGLKR